MRGQLYFPHFKAHTTKGVFGLLLFFVLDVECILYLLLFLQSHDVEQVFVAVGPSHIHMAKEHERKGEATLNTSSNERAPLA